MSSTRVVPLVDRSTSQLRRARQALAAGRPAAALQALARVRERGEESLVRIDALLALGRHREALTVATRELRSGPVASDLGARLRLARARASWDEGRAGAAARETETAAALAEAPRTRVRVALERAFLLWQQARLTEAEQRLAEARELVQGEAWPAAALRSLEIEAWLQRDRGRLDGAFAALDRRVELARSLDRADAIAQARADRGDLLGYLGRWDEARSELELAAEGWRRLDDPRAHTVAGARLALVQIARGDLAEARVALDRARISTRGESARRLAEILLLVSDLELASVRPRLAEAEAAEAARLFARLLDREGECRARVRRSHALLGLGQVDAAIREASSALRLGRSREHLVVLSEIARGRALLRSGQPAEHVFERALAGAEARPALAAAAGLGLALSRGGRPGQLEVDGALQALEDWGDRRIVTYARADLNLEWESPKDVAQAPGVREAEPEPESSPSGGWQQILGRSEGMRRVFEELRRFGPARADVHVVGETGTGKERIARVVHELSGRRGAFVAVNSAELPDELIDSILFGHVKGAFTGASCDRLGLVREAEGGSLFLDEVQDLTPRAQARLLRFLQEREYRRLGESGPPQKADVRVITASNVPLERKVERGEMRADVMYRLQVLVLRVPPLRERGDDVALLARALAKRCAAEEGRPVPSLSADALEAIRRHCWPGNVRELQNAVRVAVVAAREGAIRREHLPAEVRGGDHPSVDPALKDAVSRYERTLVVESLARHSGNRTRAAATLGLTRQGLALKLRRLGL